MVPGSTLIYGSSLMCVTLRPRASISAPIDAAASPLPMELTTPPVTKMYLVRFIVVLPWGHAQTSTQPRRECRCCVGYCRLWSARASVVARDLNIESQAEDV